MRFSRRALLGAGGALVGTLGARALVGDERPLTSALADATELAVPAGSGCTLVVSPSPFALSLLDAGGTTVLATVPGAAGPPLSPPALNSPQPYDPAGAVAGVAGLAFVLGADTVTEIPSEVLTGDQLLGASAGALVPLLEVETAQRTAGGFHLEVATSLPAYGRATVDITSLPSGGVEVVLGAPALLPVASTLVGMVSPADEGLYGLGGRKDAFDQRGLLRVLWVDQENMGAGPLSPETTKVSGPTATYPNGAQAAYYIQALLFGSRGWAAWTGQSTVAVVDLASSHPEVVRWGTAGRDLQLFVAGGGLEAASAAYTALAGRGPLPPTWAYLPWMDVINQQGEGDAAPYGGGFNGGAAVAQRVQDVVDKSAANGIPLGVVGMEGWQAVPGVGDLVASLRQRGLHCSAYWNPFISPSSSVYNEAAAAGYLVGGPGGRPYLFVNGRGSLTGMVDFTNPAAATWWGEQLDITMRMGFEGFMEDFGEEVTEPMTFADGKPAAVEHNAYPVYYHGAARRAVDAFAAANPGFEPFFYVRSGYSTLGGGPGVTASTPGTFAGDNTTDWTPSSGLASIPPTMLNLALGGAYAFTTDVGGYSDLYTPQTTAELFTRWAQLAAMTAISRIHNSTFNGSVYPWSFDAATLDAYRRYARAKVRLAGEVVAPWARLAATKGTIGPVRPLVLDDPTPAARSVHDEWMLGHDILVAPVVVEGARSRQVYLPVGAQWAQVTVAEDGSFLRTGQVWAGGSTVEAPAPLADIPIFLRA